MIKEKVCTAIGVIGSAIAGMFGGMDVALVTLLIFMVMDYATGLVVAGVFKNSNKTKNGALESNAGWKGLCKKGMCLVIVLVAVRLDLLMRTTYIRDGVCIAFIANEAISIVENAGLMGMTMPPVLVKAIDVLTNKEGEEKNDDRTTD